jgi:hypothetical protein
MKQSRLDIKATERWRKQQEKKRGVPRRDPARDKTEMKSEPQPESQPMKGWVYRVGDPVLIRAIPLDEVELREKDGSQSWSDDGAMRSCMGHPGIVVAIDENEITYRVEVFNDYWHYKADDLLPLKICDFPMDEIKTMINRAHDLGFTEVPSMGSIERKWFMSELVNLITYQEA